MNVEDFAALAARRAEGALTKRDETRYQKALAEHPEWETPADAAADLTLDGIAAEVTDADLDATPASRRARRDSDAPAEEAGGITEAEAAAADAEAAVAAAAEPAAEEAVAAEVVPDAPVADALAAEPVSADTAITRPSVSDASNVAPAAPVSADEPADAETPADDAAPAAPAADAAPEGEPAKKPFLAGRAKLIAIIAAVLIALGLLIWGISAMAGGGQPSKPETPAAALEQITESDDPARADGALESGGIVTLYWSESANRAVLVTATLETVKKSESYVVWMTRDGNTKEVGRFTTGSAVLSDSVRKGDTVLVTLETLKDDKAPSKPGKNEITTITVK